MRIYSISKAIPLVTVVLLLALPALAQSALHRVNAVPTTKTLELEDGTMVRLAAIQVPNLARDASEQDDPLAQAAHTALERYALNKSVKLELLGQGTDRRGRTIAMVYEGDIWLQEAMLREGLAWTYTFDDSRRYASDLLAAEHEAEIARRGVWAEAVYAVLAPQKTVEHLGEFRIVEGKVIEVAEVHGHYYVNFGSDWKTDFTLLIDKDAAKHFDPAWIQALAGKTVRARGWLFEKNGPAIALSHPEQVEIKNEKPVAAAGTIGVVMRD